MWFSLSRTVPLRIRHSAQLVPWQKIQQGARFSISTIVTSLNRAWDCCCVYKIFKTVFLQKHGFEMHKTVFKFMTTVDKIL